MKIRREGAELFCSDSQMDGMRDVAKVSLLVILQTRLNIPHSEWETLFVWFSEQTRIIQLKNIKLLVWHIVSTARYELDL
jgi:hypothetical protein